MLPSMPFLFTASRDSVLNEDKSPACVTSDPNNDANLKDPTISNNISTLSYECLPVDERECADELVLLAENSPFGEKRKLIAQATNPRKKKKPEAVQTPHDEKSNSDEQANHFATAYFMKAKGELDEITFQRFIALLSEINEETVNVVSLYHEIAALLKYHAELLNDFVGFLLPHQALEVGKLTELFNLEQTWNYFRKLDAFHFNKVNHLLEQISSNPNMTHNILRSSFISAFKGHPNISEGLFVLLPDEKPTTSGKEDYEDITDMSLDHNSWETLDIQDPPTKGCTSGECECVCHSFATKKFCTFCNVRFIKDQMFIQTGKGLRFAKVTFKGRQLAEELQRLHPTFYKTATSHKKTKSGSHSVKEGKPKVTGKHVAQFTDKSKTIEVTVSHEEREIPETEKLDEDDEILLLEEQLSKDNINFGQEYVLSEDVILESTNSEDMEFDSGDDFNLASPLSIKLDEDSHNSTEQTLPEKKEKKVGELNEPNNSDVLVCVETVQNNSERDQIVLPKTETTEDPLSSKIKFEEKSSKSSTEIKSEEQTNKQQTVLSDSQDKGKELTSSKVWTREEDKLILQAFQRQIGSEQTFSEISSLLPLRSVDDIQGRFQVLMNLLEKVTSGCFDVYPQ